MKNISAYATALLALVITGLFSVSASTQTLSLNDGAILRSKTNRIGLNIGSINNRDNGQILKNLIGSTNPGLEPLQDQQILVLERAGTTTRFTLPDARNNVPANYWAGGTFSVVESQSGQGEHGCSGTIESNTGVNDSRLPATGKSPVITISAPCDAPFRAGDMIILSKTAYPTPESSWESAGLGGIWGSVSGGGRLLSDTSDLCATCGTQALNLDTTPRGSSASASWHFDSDPGKIFVLMNGTYELTFWAKAAGGSPTLVASASRLTDGGFNCGSYSPKLTSTWTQYTFTCTAAETPATAPGTAQVSLKTMGGSVYLDNVSFARTSPSINNPTVLRDEVIETLQRYFGDADGASKGTFRYSLGQDGQSMTNWTEPDYAELPTAAGAASFVGPDGGGSMRLSLEDYLVICQFLGGDPYLEVPATFSVTDSANLIEFLAGPTGTTYGLRRAALGQDSPWSEVFEKIHLSFCDECWNPDFAGKNLPLRATALTSQLYLDYGQRARDIFAAMRADSSYSANSFDLVMGARTAVNSSMDAAIQIAHPDSIEIDGHFYSTANRSTPDSALWKSAMVEPYAKVTNPSDPDNFSGSILDYQSQKSCGASGTADCNVQIGQWSQETLNGSIDELHLDSITARAGEGVVMALQPLLNLQYYGISPQMMLSLTQHEAASATGLTTLNGGTVDMGGATNNVRPAFLAMSLVNQSIIGPMYSCSITNNLTHDFAGSANGIYSIPATKGVPYLYAFCFENGTRRSLVLINTDLVKTHTLNFRGNNLPAGSVIQRQYAPASLDDMNESPAGQNSDNTAATVSVETSTLSSPGSITLPPHSVTALDYTAASEPMTAAPTFTPSTGAYTTPQTVTITSTAAATIYYTTDGSVPTTSSSVYSSPIVVSASQTLKAMAIASGFENSPVVTADYAISTAAPVLDATHEATEASAVAASLPTSPSSTAAKTSFATEAATTTGPVFNCPAGFVSTASSSCGVAFIGGSGPNFAVVGTNDGLNPTMSGTAVDVMPSPPGAHAALSLMYEQAVNVQAFATTYTFVPDGVNISLIFNNTNNTGSFMGSDFSAGAGCEGGFFQAFGASPNNVFSLELDSGDALTYNGTFTYSGVQVYQSQQDPCTNPYNSDYFTPKLSTSPVPLNNPASTKLTTTGDTYSATVTYDGTTLSMSLYDVTAGGSCPGSTCFTQSWSAINIPSIVGANTAYVGLVGGDNSDTAGNLYINSWTYTVNSAPSSPSLSTYTTSTAGGNVGATSPVFSPAAGTYSGTQNVTISNSTSGSYFCYILSSTTPSVYPWPDSLGNCQVGTKYSGAISVASTQTLYAVAGTSESIGAPSNQVSGLYTIGSTSTAATPTFSVAAGTYASSQTVTVSDATAGATIYYTTNGTTPTTSSSTYGGPITVSSTETLEAIAVETGYTNSAVATAAYTINSSVPAPTFSPAGGTYTTTQTVTISDSTAGTTIYYTTNGTTPTTSSTVYTGPITVNSTETLEAIAIATGDANAVGMATYTIAPVLPTPAFSVAAGTYTTAQTVTISDSTAGTTIYYTTNGATPTSSSTVYTGPITVSTTETLQAIAVETGYTSSPVAIAAYTISTGSTIYINYPSSGFTSTSLNLNGGATVTSGGQLQLTDGGGNESRSAWFTAQVPVQTFVTDFTFQQLNANADGLTFTIQTQGTSALGETGGSLGYQGITPSVAVKFDLYNNEGEGIDSTGLYTDGASPTVPSVDLSSTGINLHSGDIMHAHMVYDGTNLTMTLTDTVTSAFVTEVFPVNIPSLVGNTAWVGFTGGTGGETSTQNILSWSFTSLAAAPAATPTFSPAAGTYAASQSVTISDATAGTTIYYTTNGTAPTTSSTVYTGPLTVSATETLEATAVATGYTNSATASAAYTISPAVPAPTFSPAAGTYTTTQTVTISETTAGTTIYYTTNGTTPTTSSTVYTGPITVSATETLEAIAVETGDSNAVGMATYTIAPVLPTPTFSLATGTYTTTQTITISDATAGTTIYYTTNGTTPTTSSAEYTGPITVSATETIEAKAVETGYTNSAAFSATYTIAPVLPTPTFSLATGTYTTTQTVTISDATAGTTIYYTTNGATPTTSSTLYTGPITVCASEKLQAIAVETGYTDSAAASATYTLNLPALPVPSFSLAAGTYAESQTVTISDATAGTTIYYTTNSTTPTTSSTPYTGPITVGETETVKAIAVETGYINSVIASASYTITPLPTPTFSVAAGTYASMQTVTISDATAGTTIYYTTDTTTPTASSTPYTGPITVSATEAVKAIAMETGYIKSAVATADYTITPLPAPTFSVAAGTYASMQTVTISDATAGTTIYYTTDTTTPTASSTPYTGPITVSATEALKAIAMETGYIKSAVATADYTIAPLPTPTFSVAAGTYASMQTVTISDATAGTTIYYTTDTTTPTASSTPYTGPITVSATETVKAIAMETGYIKSAVATADYTITPLPAPTFSVAAGTYTTTQTVTISDATAGTTIYYTTDATTPTASSTQYTGPITVGATETVKAIAVETGCIKSAVATADYTINTGGTT